MSLINPAGRRNFPAAIAGSPSRRRSASISCSLAGLVMSAFLFCGPAMAGAPVITELQPRGAAEGAPFTLTVMGRELGEGVQIISSMPASFTPLAQAEQGGRMMPGRAAAFLVEPRQPLSPGVYPIRVRSAAGISNVLLFTIGNFPELTEEESSLYSPPHKNDTIETAEAIRSVPVTLNGTLKGAERDLFRVYGKAGERRVFEVEARRSGSAIDPVLRILDGSGNQLARSEDTPGTGLDARLDFAFPKEGNYYVEVHDARFSTQAQNFYRLKMGSYSYADSIFPLGGRRGEKVQVALSGAGLKSPAKVTADLTGVKPDEHFTTVALPGSPTLPFLFAVGEYPEVTEPVNTELPLPGVVNGRLSQPGEIDRYRLKVQAGDKLLLEMEARNLGTSRIEGVISLFDAKGKKLDSDGDKPLPEDVFAVQNSSRTSSDPFLNFTVPEGMSELTVAVEDLALRGGPHYGYRLIVRRQPEDFRLSLGTPHINIPAGGTTTVAVNADRRGYDGEIRLTIPDLPPGIKVEGGYIPRESVDANNARTMNRRGVLSLTADPGVELPPRELVVWGEGKMDDGSVIRRRARGPGMSVNVSGATTQGSVDRQRPVTAPWLGLDLPAAITDPPPATLEVRQVGKKQLEEGAQFDFEYKWNVMSRMVDLPRNVTVEIVGARDIRITNMRQAPPEKGGGAPKGSFTVNTTKATSPARYDLYITGKLPGASGDDLIFSRPITFEVTEGSSPANVASVQ